MAGAEPKRWYVGNWSPLGWAETAIKLVALAAALIALVTALAGGVQAAPEGARLIQVIVLVVLALGLLAAIVDRLMGREIIAMIFVLVNNLGHWGMVYALLTLPGPGALLLVFAGLMLLGDLVKLYWLRVSGFTVRNFPRSVLFGLTGVYVVGYALLIILALTSGGA